MIARIASQSASRLDISYLLPAISSILLGLTLILTVGFARLDTIHNATHDTRHSAAFPCH